MANGGCFDWIYLNNDLCKEFEADAATTNLHDVSEHTDAFIGIMVDDHLNTKRLKRMCKSKTVFTLKSSVEGDCYTIKHPYDERVKDHLNNKYGDDLVEIINERFIA